jgi:hypothetical protein
MWLVRFDHVINSHSNQSENLVSLVVGDYYILGLNYNIVHSRWTLDTLLYLPPCVACDSFGKGVRVVSECIVNNQPLS